MAVNLRDLHRVWMVAAVLPLVVALAGCDVSMGNLAGRATDEWTHTYPLAAGGELEIANTNGKIEIEGVDGSTVEVRAERIAKAATDAGARELLPRIVIKEDAKPDHVTIETERITGFMIGANFEVRYHVRVPKNVFVHVTNTNGQVAATALGGKLLARTTNGGIIAKDVSGAVEAQTTNGNVSVDMASLTHPVSLKTTNGAVVLTVPDDAKADLAASCANGGIAVAGLELNTTENSRRHVEGTLNGGGTKIDLRTTNGGIRIRGRSADTDKSQR